MAPSMTMVSAQVFRVFCRLCKQTLIVDRDEKVLAHIRCVSSWVLVRGVARRMVGQLRRISTQ